MKKVTLCLFLLFALALAAAVQFTGKNMHTIKFVLGKNIVETAKESGIPEYGVSNIDGYIEYAARPLPAEIPVIYTKTGYEITVIPAFSFVLAADRKRTPNDIVFLANIRVGNKHIRNHQDGKLFVEKLLGQFDQGKWKRHVTSSCPAVTGRSSYLDLAGLISSDGCALDSKFRIETEDWIELFKETQKYEWVGDGVLATVGVGYDDDTRGIIYNIEITFQDFKAWQAINMENEASWRKEGDAKGWSTTRMAEDNLKNKLKTIKQLEEQALKRGDTLIGRD